MLGSYMKAAFVAPANLLALGAAVVGSAATGSSLPLYVAGFVEVLYLLMLPLSPRFRRAVRAMEAEAGLPLEAGAGALLAELAPSQRGHYLALRELKEQILANYRKLPGGRVLASASEQRLDALLSAFLRLLVALEEYRRHLSAASRQEVERELLALRAELGAEENQKVREVKQKRAEILEKRLRRLAQAQESREVVSHQLAAIEDLFRLTHEQSIAIRDPESVTRQLELLSAEAQATEETVKEMASILEISDELPSISPEGLRT